MLLVAAGFGLWWLSDQLLSIGPLDRATFGWAVVVPIWLGVPLGAAVASRGLDARVRTRMATVLGLIVAGIGALLLWRGLAFPICENGAVRGPESWIAPALVLGAVVGGGLAVSSTLAGSQLAEGHRLMAVIAGAGAQAAFLVVGILVFSAVSLTMAGCQRPV
ncbi:MAG TPA: hypothetical protein VFP56_08900 [Candidatus Limnocylindrales bacterium]|nr:hypothetical protein [Candidatus Limnocylindrales bacterium]